MALDGVWKMTIESDDIDPEIVPREATLTIKVHGSELRGSMAGPYPMGEGVMISHGAVNGGCIRWTAAMRGELLRPQVLEFTGTLSGEEINGEVEVGIFGTATFIATHA
jgi:hypothetical protein